jgi:Family of unknown function (DUF5678)
MVEETKSMSPIQHPTVPIEYAGKWIAWDHAMTHIVASGTTPREVLEAARKAGENDPILGKSPPANVRLIGARVR